MNKPDTTIQVHRGGRVYDAEFFNYPGGEIDCRIPDWPASINDSIGWKRRRGGDE